VYCRLDSDYLSVSVSFKTVLPSSKNIILAGSL